MEYSKGGLVPQQDEIVPVLALPGEVRVSKETVKKYGWEIIKALNKGCPLIRRKLCRYEKDTEKSR